MNNEDNGKLTGCDFYENCNFEYQSKKDIEFYPRGLENFSCDKKDHIKCEKYH